MGTSSHKVENIFLHCSATPWGDALIFDSWHRERGWEGIGYHYVILNGRPFPDVNYWGFLDGQIQPGRPLDDDPIFEPDEIGTHVAGRNGTSIGVCLVGKSSFTDNQLVAAKHLIVNLMFHFGLKVEHVLGHCEDKLTNKTCPNIPMDPFRGFLKSDSTVSLPALQEKIKLHVKEIYK